MNKSQDYDCMEVRAQALVGMAEICKSTLDAIDSLANQIILKDQNDIKLSKKVYKAQNLIAEILELSKTIRENT